MPQHSADLLLKSNTPVRRDTIFYRDSMRDETIFKSPDRGLIDFGAGDGTRTRNPQLGKLMRYHCATPAQGEDEDWIMNVNQ